MAPKEGPMGIDAFLVVCIKNSAVKPAPNWESVANATGLSKGGARNKFNAIMKQFENEGATITKAVATPKAPAAKRKPAAKNTKVATSGEEDEEDAHDAEEPPKKKAATAKAKKAQAVKKPTAAKKKVTEEAEAESEADDLNLESGDEE